MSKHHAKEHNKNLAFEKEGEHIIIPLREERVLTAEGFRRRSQSCQATRSPGIYRGRRQGKKG
jgi:hypothetical protein